MNIHRATLGREIDSRERTLRRMPCRRSRKHGVEGDIKCQRSPLMINAT